MLAQILDKTAFTVVGVEAAFLHALSPQSTNFKVIPPLWDQLFHRIGEIRHRIGDTMFGIVYGRPERERSHPHELQYIAAVPVSSTTDVPTGMVSYTVPAATFAVFTHRGPVQTIGKTVEEIYRHWLPQSPYRQIDVADVELYDHRFCHDSDESEMEYWIAVTPKSTPTTGTTP